MSRDLIVVTGAGGFIGGHLAGALLKDGLRVRDTSDGGREKAPSALGGKEKQAKLGGERDIAILGDRRQTCNFTCVDDCTEGISRITVSAIVEPFNLG